MRQSLALEQLGKRYDRTPVVREVSLTIERGQFVTLLGPSGSGKTTILMMIAGFVAPSAGRILLDGEAITALPPEKRNFGMVFQGYALFPHLSVADNVGFSLRVRHRPKSEIVKRVAEALALVQLSELGQRLPRQLSGGQQQRVALARALAFSPDLLLLDEPLSALDRKLRGELQAELKSLHAKLGVTFIAVTHDQEEALSLSDRVAILRRGALVQYGTPRELYEAPRSRFVADFLGRSNFLSGYVEGLGQGEILCRCGATPLRQRVAPGAAHRPGDAVLVALRPEKIALAAAAPATDNAVAGTIRRWSYTGTHLDLAVATADLGEIAVTLPAWRSPIEPGEGQAVWLGWDAEAATLVEDD